MVPASALTERGPGFNSRSFLSPLGYGEEGIIGP